MQNPTNLSSGGIALRRRAASLAVASLFAAAGAAQAFEINTGNEDLAMRWDNTLRYNLGVRAQSQNSTIMGNPNFDDGDRNFGNGSLVTNRFDVLSEFDLIWQKKYGLRVSGAGWWDAAYNSLDNSNTATANTLVNGLPAAGVLSPYTKRYAKGASGEWLDAFTFANFEIGDIPVNIKAGQHTVYWGDSLLLGGAVHGVSYAQNSLDIWKGFATPGTEAKELFRPRGGLTIQAQPANDLSIAGQWFYNWQAIRVPESGSYLTVNDGLQFGADSTLFQPNPYKGLIPGAPDYLRLWQANTPQLHATRAASATSGISARWSPQWLDGTLGFYYRNATDIVPQVVATVGFAATARRRRATRSAAPWCPADASSTRMRPLPRTSRRRASSGPTASPTATTSTSPASRCRSRLAASRWAPSCRIARTCRWSATRWSCCRRRWCRALPARSRPPRVPANGTPGALGNTMHGIVNAINIFPKTALFDTATLTGELTWMQWLSVTQNEAVFRGRDNYSSDRPGQQELRRTRIQFHADLVPGLPRCRHPRAGRPGARG